MEHNPVSWGRPRRDHLLANHSQVKQPISHTQYIHGLLYSKRYFLDLQLSRVPL